MSIEVNPARERRTHRVVRQAVGRQLTRTIVLCALSLAGGVALGQYLLRQQLQLQQGVVGQLQHEIRGLTSDIQRMELSSSRSIARFENTLARLESAQRFELAGESRITQERLATLERLVQRQVAATQSAQAACLAEFEHYRSKSLAVPVEMIAAAVERFTQSRTADLGVLAGELQSHAEMERQRLATLESQWNLSGAAPTSLHPIRRAKLEGSVPGFPYAHRQPSVSSTPASEVETPPATDAGAMETAAGTTDSPPSAIPVAIAAPRDSSVPAPVALMPIPDGPPPVPRSAAHDGRARKSRPYLLSFASGRRVADPPPAAAPVATLPEAGGGER